MHLSISVIGSSITPKSKMSGLGLPMAIFIITVMAFIAVAINELSESGAKSTGVNALSMRAFYAAESGANIALTRMFPPGAAGVVCAGPSTTILSNVSDMLGGLAQCSVTVVCTPSASSTYTLNSVGTCGSGADQTTRIVEVVVE